ncbi:alpha/beta-hydrolase [Dentipellis sp. KUC8613]|nr:alpha/beta-hydrolase [Dentipellis sp. KUC8613]
MPVSAPFHCLTLSLLVFPPLFLAAYFIAQFPHAPEVTAIHASLASLPKHCKSWDIYPEDFYPGGAYVSLPFGRVRYWLLGPEDGKKVVLIHGLSVPAIIWKDVAPTLASRGFRVLLYDLYGRGYSDAPQTAYDANLYATQLALLMQHINWDKTFVAGVSMGGGIATAFSQQFPQLVENRVVLIASAGLMETSDMSRTTKFMSSPLVQSVTSSSPFRFYLQRLANNSSTDPISEVVRIQSAHLPGYNAAIASSLRDGPIRGLSSSFKSLGKSNRDVLLIWGTADNTVPYKYALQMQSLVPQSTLITIQGGRHDLTISHPETISDAIVRFFI